MATWVNKLGLSAFCTTNKFRTCVLQKPSNVQFPSCLRNKLLFLILVTETGPALSLIGHYSCTHRDRHTDTSTENKGLLKLRSRASQKCLETKQFHVGVALSCRGQKFGSFATSCIVTYCSRLLNFTLMQFSCDVRLRILHQKVVESCSITSIANQKTLIR